MLLHIIPKYYSVTDKIGKKISLINVTVKELNLVLKNDVDIVKKKTDAVGRCFVVCRKGSEAEGLLLDIDNMKEINTITRWSFNGRVLTHTIKHVILGEKYAFAASSDPWRWLLSRGVRSYTELTENERILISGQGDYPTVMPFNLVSMYKPLGYSRVSEDTPPIVLERYDTLYVPTISEEHLYQEGCGVYAYKVPTKSEILKGCHE